MFNVVFIVASQVSQLILGKLEPPWRDEMGNPFSILSLCSLPFLYVLSLSVLPDWKNYKNMYSC